MAGNDYFSGRPSTEENAPLLQDPDREGHPGSSQNSNTTFADRVNSVAHEPLTPLTKILLIIALFLLLMSSIFIGLFAGAQHKLSTGRGGGGGDGEKHPEITTTTRTRTTTTTEYSTTTQVSTTTTTTTKVVTLPAPGPTTPPFEKPCLEPHCVALAASILGSLDVTQDPCENFYDFANGGWLSSHPLPADKSSFGNFEALAQQNKQVLQRIVERSAEASESVSNYDYDAEILKKLGDQYKSCLDEKYLNEIGEKPLRHIVKVIRKLYREEDTDITAKVFKGEQEGTDSTPKFNGLTAALSYLHSRGIPALFGFDIEGDVGEDPNKMALWFNQPELGLPSKEYYEEESIVKLYKETLSDLLEGVLDILDNGKDDKDKEGDGDDDTLKAFINNDESQTWPPWPWPPWGGDEPDDDGGEKEPGSKEPKSVRARKLAKDVVKFENKIANASLDLDILFQDPIATYNPVHLSNLTSTLSQIEFPAYFAAFTPRTFPERVIVTYPAYARSLSEILDDTSKEVIEAYLVTRALLQLAPYLGTETDLWKSHRRFYETLNGIKKGAVGDRAEWCVSRVEETLGFAAGRYFVNETFAGESKQKGTKIMKDIVNSFKESLKDLDWMDEKSAKAAAEKADAIRIKVGYPLSPDTLNPRSIAFYYRTVKIDQSKFLDNMLSAASSNEFRKWLQLGRQRDLESWEMFPSTVNAYYNPPSSEVVFPAGILQPPFFQANWPGYLNYGAFGQVASHELTHAFDSAGRLYNQKGKLEEWWTNKTSERFMVKQKCIVHQYSQYTIDDGKGGRIHVNGNLTSGENIGDSGLVQAWRAWKAQYGVSLENGEEYLLPGLKYTREQLFFIGFASIWARAMKPAAAVQRIRTDPHSPSRYRVDGTVSNIPEFADAFKCSKKAKLNPPQDQRCIFWG
ncbi:hypothetical protein D9611_004556 [Ephemerocybe angulata]|uniref:Endothelin-converting enzyme 1 n=1 Tax=Ephemerocybe angulata TaxID=980116 RepID=A0A8H5BLQ6_9AGAR|nr:hypothetical protein D9611_004556 [Tulosesus angulatus]